MILSAAGTPIKIPDPRHSSPTTSHHPQPSCYLVARVSTSDRGSTYTLVLNPETEGRAYGPRHTVAKGVILKKGKSLFFSKLVCGGPESSRIVPPGPFVFAYLLSEFQFTFGA